MVYFQINPIGFDCRKDKNNCEKYPDFCKECVKAQLEKFGLNLDHNFKFTIIDSEEKIIDFIEKIDYIISEGITTLSDTQVIKYKHR